MAQATRMVMGADTLLAIWPDIEHGWYYDFDFGDKTLEESKLKDIEKKMRSIIREGQDFRQFSLSIEDARTFLVDLGDKYKLEMANDLAQKGETTISFFANIGAFQNPAYAKFDFLNNPETRAIHNETWLAVSDKKEGESWFDFRWSTFIDMCQWPHINSTRDVTDGTFRLEKIAGAYWRWDSDREQLTRIYGLAFESKEALQKHDYMMEEAKKRDHRIIGKKMKLFTISDLVGPWLVLIQPRGMIIRKAIEDYLWDLHKDRWYDRVWSPHLAKESLYETSGHAGHYLDDMFSVFGGTSKEKFFVKPMNCPHHMQIFADNQFSYRDMPIRYFEPATVYRDEKTGQLSGLTRVRAITQDDGHLFCRIEQIKDEVSLIVEIIKEFYTTFGLMDGYWVSLSVRDPETPEKYLWSDEVWETAEKSLEDAATSNGLNYKKIEWEAAFYGPKLDFMFRDAIGREWQLATIQCDFNLPDRFELAFTNEQWEDERPVVIHRAISGSLERFMGIMIEHFAGVFPLWLAPEQVRIVPVWESCFDYAEDVFVTIKKAGIRVKLDDSNDSLGKKIRNAETGHVNYIVVVWEKEIKDGTLAVRNYKTKWQSIENTADFVEKIQIEIQKKSL